MKTKIIFLTLVMVLGIYCFSSAQDDSGLVVDEIQICASVEGRTPQGTALSFSADIERVYCFTKLKNSGESSKVIHAWYYKDKEMARVELSVRAATWRTWSSKRILPSWTGEWRVDVLSPDGNVLSSKSFEIK
ncbi:DUF2914 domain-containing protein [Thermodesulfobacteriota bacterium]